MIHAAFYKEDCMSQPTPVALRPHHGYQSWTSTWRDDQGHRRTKRFGKESEISEIEAVRKYQNWLANEFGAKPHVRNPEDPRTIKFLADGYQAYADRTFVKDGKPTGHASNVKYAMDELRNHYADLPVGDVDYPKIVSLLNSMIIGRNGSRILSIKTVNGRLFCIKAAFHWGRGQGLVSAVTLSDVSAVDPLKSGRCAAKPIKVILPVSEAVIERTKKHLPAVVQDMIDVQTLTGMRPGELCNMRPCDLDISDRKVWIYTPRSHKTEQKKKVRKVPIGPRAQKIIAAYLRNRITTTELFSPLEAQQQRRDKATRERTKNGTPLNQGNRTGTNRKRRPKLVIGTRYDAQSYRKAIRYACKAIRKDDPAFSIWHPHQLRHSAASKARETRGYEAAVDLLGHAAPSTTAIYAERSLERAKKIARKVG